MSQKSRTPERERPITEEASEARTDADPRLPALTRWLLGLCVLLALAVVFFACLIPIGVTDFWWQARTGELIFRTGSIPTRDPFSWTARGQPWLVHEWLTEVLFYLAFTGLPNWVLLLYKCGLGAIACGLVMMRGWVRSGSLPLGIAAGVGAGYVLRNYADLRPQMITFVLLAGLLLALDEYRAGRMARLPWALPFVFIVWANLHGGVVVGLLLFVLWTAAEGAAWLVWGDRGYRLRPIALAVGASSLTVALNPNGFHVYAYPFQVLGHPKVMDYITEWYSPNFHREDMRAFEVMLIAVFAVLAAAARKPGERPGGRFGDLMILAAMAHAALTAQRNTVPFALAAAPLLAEGLASLWREALEGEQAPRRAPSFQRFAKRLGEWPLTPSLGAAGLAAALGVLLYLQIPRVAPARWFEYAISWRSFPLQAVEKMKAGAWPGLLYNDYVWGGYLIWKLYPQRAVFIDGRAEVYYRTGAFDDEMTIHNVAAGWQGVLDKRGVQVILTERNGGLARSLDRSSRWDLAFLGEVEAVYVRAAP